MKRVIYQPIFITAGLIGLTVFSGLILSSTIVLAEDLNSNEVGASVIVPKACTMSGQGMSSHTAEVSNGAYRTDIGTTTITVVCNDSSGFSIFATGFTGDVIAETNSNKLVGTSASGYATIDTGTATSAGNPDVSNWAMKLTAASGAGVNYPLTISTGYDSYHAVPNTWTKVATRLSGTDSGTNAEGSTMTTTYAAYISKPQPADTYTGKVKYTLVHPSSEVPPAPQPSRNNNIGYFANSALASGVVGDQYIATGDTPALTANNFSRSGYGFAGWNDAYDYSGTFYGMNETINVTAEMETNGMNLYAVWVESSGYMQDSNTVSSVCNSLTAASVSNPNTLSSVAALTDRRDGNTYAIAKLADGKCWMIENLRLASSTELSTSNTHNPFTINNTVSIVNDNGTTTNHLSASSSGWCVEDSTTCDDQSKLNSDNVDLYLSNTSGSKTSYMYSYGNYYNWYSATAGNGTRLTLSGSTTGDICPTGWRLPTGGSNSEMTSINAAANAGSTTTSAGLRTFPNNFAFSGMVSQDTGNISDRSWYGNYWSSSAANGGAYGIRISDGGGGTNPTDIPWKYTGHSVRCIADLQYN